MKLNTLFEISRFQMYVIKQIYSFLLKPTLIQNYTEKSYLFEQL